ncbi:Na-translocating system protein MpsC family protein [Paenibacillus sp. MMS20-IR301]|uniref:Na-translocating system protein MpsC family protein n=1 Tax=Paenibacillus sp. MMS20-IR301 TaxID=2895946 RepID=UPI0028F0D697|nr:Na-translocating system protein MpsC family protein [Paenibacillus sp. MMS20-IR301]WNS42940.1 Na-translocating system protein MpsC family protein [Paenibacillus sp. MMS20-IR301]
MSNTELASQLSSFTGRLLRERFGKGPESIHASIGEQCIALHIRNFIGPVERFLLSKEEEQAFRYTRELLMKSLLPELSAYLKDNMAIEVGELFYDWGIHNASGMIVALIKNDSVVTDNYAGREEVHSQINEVSSKVQKEPVFTDSWWLGPRILIIKREGILIPLEKELIGLGYENTLKTTKRKMEKRYLEDTTTIAPMLGKELSDIYVDWDFDKDTSVIAYTFQ